MGARTGKARDVTGKSWWIDDDGGDSLVIYAADAMQIGVGTQRKGQRQGFAVLLDAAKLDRVIAELTDRRARMPQ